MILATTTYWQLYSLSSHPTQYPKQLAHEVPETINGLVQVRNRKYGRTWIVVYGPPSLTSREYAEEFGDEDD